MSKELEYTNYFNAEYITDEIQNNLSPKEQCLHRTNKDYEEQPLVLMNAIGFLSDFYENDSEDDDPELKHRRPIIDETINKLSRLFLLQLNDQDRRDFINNNGSQSYTNTKSNYETLKTYLERRGIKQWVMRKKK